MLTWLSLSSVPVKTSSSQWRFLNYIFRFAKKIIKIIERTSIIIYYIEIYYNLVFPFSTAITVGEICFSAMYKIYLPSVRERMSSLFRKNILLV